MTLAFIDWLSIIGFFIISLVIGISVSKRAGSSTAEFFASGRSMPWWLLGVSMVATTFSGDTPNLITDMVRQHGVAGNWLWWAFLLTGMVTVFIYAKLWRRSDVLTDIEFYELRYSGKTAAFLRGFRALYLGIFFNIVIMASVLLAAIKMGGVMFGVSPLTTIFVSCIIVMLYSMLGGLTGVLLTDTTVSWILVTLLTNPTDHKTLMQFYRKVIPSGPGWNKVIEQASQYGENVDGLKKQKWDAPSGLTGVLLGLILIYGLLFSIGFWLYSNTIPAVITMITSVVSGFLLIRLWSRFKVL